MVVASVVVNVLNVVKGDILQGNAQIKEKEVAFIQHQGRDQDQDLDHIHLKEVEIKEKEAQGNNFLFY